MKTRKTKAVDQPVDEQITVAELLAVMKTNGFSSIWLGWAGVSLYSGCSEMPQSLPSLAVALEFMRAPAPRRQEIIAELAKEHALRQFDAEIEKLQTQRQAVADGSKATGLVTVGAMTYNLDYAPVVSALMAGVNGFGIKR